MPLIYPSLISGDLLNLNRQIELLDAHCAGYHLDVMDGHFVPNLTWGPAFVNAIAAKTTKQTWVHLMTTNPQRWVERLELPKKSMIDLHLECNADHKTIIKIIRNQGWLAGISIHPVTPIEECITLLPLVDYVVPMTVAPGFSGQAFMPQAVQKMAWLTDYKHKHGLHFFIGADGGINQKTIPLVTQAGTTHCAVASAIFNAVDPVKAVKTLAQI